MYRKIIVIQQNGGLGNLLLVRGLFRMNVPSLIRNN